MLGYDTVSVSLQAGDDLGEQLNASIQWVKNTQGGGRIIIPPGEHSIETQIVLESKIWLAGRTREATVLKLAAGYTPTSMIYGSGKEDLKFSNLTLDANNLEKNLIHFMSCERISGDDLGFKNGGGGSSRGIFMEGGSKYGQFRDLKFNSMPIGIYLGPSASLLLFEGLHADSLCGKLAQLTGIYVTDCEFKAILSENLTTDFHLLDGPSRILIDGLISKQADETSVSIQYISEACSEIVIVNSEILDAGYSSANVYPAIHIEANHSRVRVVNTRTINSNAKQKYGVLIDAGASECEIRGGKHEGVTAAWLNNGTSTLIDSRR